MDQETAPSPAGNRQTIIERGLELFARRGFDAVGVQEIVAAAGVTKPTLYHYFESKAGLLQAILDAYGQELQGELRQAARYSGDVPLTLEGIAFCLVGYAGRQPRFYRFLLSLHLAPSESEAAQAGRELLESLQAMVTGTFAAARAQLGNMHGREALFAASFFGLLNTWIGLSLNGQTRLDEQAVRAVVRQFMYGIHS
jgi:TetR/AcrR family transcriptional regulator